MKKLLPLAILLLLCITSLARAQTRYALAIQGDQDGAFQGALQSHLIGQGAILMDIKQSKALDALERIEKLIQGQVPKLITTLSADRLLAIELSARSLVKSRFIQHAHQRIRCSLSARLIAVDSAQALSAWRLEGEGAAAGDKDAKALATEYCFADLAKALAGKIKTVQEQALGLVKVTVKDLPNLHYAKAIASALHAIDGVQKVRLVHAEHRAARFLVTLAPFLSGLDLGFLLSDSQDVGLILLQVTKRAVLCRYSESRALSAQLVFRPFSVEPHVLSKDAGLHLARLTAKMLLDRPYLQMRKDAQLADQRGAPWAVTKSQLQAMGLQPDETIVLEGSLLRAGAQVMALVHLRSGQTGQILMTRRAFCGRKREDLLGCALSLSAAIGVSLPLVLFEHRRSLLGVAFIRQAKMARMEVMEAQVEPLFALHAHRYKNIPIGSLNLVSESLHQMEDLQVTAKVLGFGPARSTPFFVPSPKAGSTVNAIGSLYVTLDEDKLGGIEEPRDVTLELLIQWTEAGQKVQKKKQVQTVLLGQDTAPRSDPRMLAAFIHKKDEGLSVAIPQLLAQLPQKEKGSLLAPVAAAVEAVAQVKERTERLDNKRWLSVQAPSKTLLQNEGSCLDRSVALMSLLSGLGAKVGYILKPDSLLILVQIADGTMSGQGKGLYGHKNGAYLPLNVCQESRSLAIAWKAGIKTLQGKEGRWSQLILLDGAHETFGPAPRPGQPVFAFSPAQLLKLKPRIQAALEHVRPKLIALLQERP